MTGTIKHGICFTLPKKLAKRLSKLLSEEFSMESRRVLPDLISAITKAKHKRYVSFVVDENDVDGYVAIQLTCMEFIFKSQEAF